MTKDGGSFVNTDGNPGSGPNLTKVPNQIRAPQHSPAGKDPSRLREYSDPRATI
jgi:hypothetical protein